MLFFAVLLATTLLPVPSHSGCFYNTKKLQCVCLDENGQNIFNLTQNISNNGTWSVHLDDKYGNCSPSTVIDLLPPSWSININISVSINPGGDIENQLKKKGYERIGNSFYKLYTNGTYWDAARRACMKDGAHLAIMNSDIEASNLALFLKTKMNFIEDAEDKDSVFIGFHDLFEEGEYLTIFGEPLYSAGFDIWAPNKPDNRGEIQQGLPGNDCGGLHKSGTLIDLGCDWFHAFLCEIDYGDEPETQMIDYSKSSFPGIELTRVPPSGTKKRTEPGLGYTHYPGIGFYRYHTTPVVWDIARVWCEREGAHLAVVNSKKEMKVLNKIINRVPKHFFKGKWKNFYVLIGFHCLFKHREFIGLFNETTKVEIQDNIWATDEYVGENCGGIDHKGRTNDIDCHLKFPFICEKELLV